MTRSASSRRYPKWVSCYIDNRGQERLRFRRTGSPTHHFKAAFGTPAFETEYRVCLEELPLSAPSPFPPGSIGELFQSYQQSTRFGQLGLTTQRKYARILAEFSDRWAFRLAKTITSKHMDAIIAEKIDRPAAAAELRKCLKGVWKWGRKFSGLDPAVVTDTDSPRLRKGGFYTWKPSDIQKFRDRWPLGSQPRLMLELALHSGLRRSDLHDLGWQNLGPDGWLDFDMQKGDRPHSVPVHRDLMSALDLVSRDQRYFVESARGTHYTAEAYSNAFRKFRKEAGLERGSLHGLRKSLAVSLAHGGATDPEGMTVLGHQNARTFGEYRREAEREKLASAAMDKLEIGEQLGDARQTSRPNRWKGKEKWGKMVPRKGTEYCR